MGRLFVEGQNRFQKPRPDFIKHYSELVDDEVPHYPGSSELFGIGSALGRKLGLKRLGIHHELLKPGRRTSYPHAESDEEKFVFVIDGYPDVWIDGEIYPLQPGDAVGFPCGTGISHIFINNSPFDIRLMVVGEASKPGNKIYYPLNLERKEQVKEAWWSDVPKRPLGSHHGRPDPRN